MESSDKVSPPQPGRGDGLREWHLACGLHGCGGRGVDLRTLSPCKGVVPEMITIPDVSFYQDDDTTSRMIDFKKLRVSSPAVIIRAGQNTWIDSDFKANWAAAREAGLKRGSYWFYDSRSIPKSQAQLWASALGEDLGELPLWCDFEEKYGGAYSGWKHWYDFMAELQRLLPTKDLGVYTGYYYWVENTTQAGIPPSSLEWFGKFPLWVARYNATEPLIPKPWTDWTFWQYTDKGDGSLYGVESANIDLNYFNGSEEEFCKRFPDGGYVPPITPPTGDTMTTYTMYTIYPDTRIRPVPNTGQKELVFIPLANTKVVGSEMFVAKETLRNSSGVVYQLPGDKWLKVVDMPVNGVNYTGWVSLIHKGLPICKNLTVTNDGDLPVDPPVVVEPAFTPTFTLVQPNGAKGEYKFVRIIEE